MNLWGATPLLVAALLGGGHAAASPAASPHSTVSPRPSPTPHPASPATSSGVVLIQAGTGKWQATVLLNRAIAIRCPQVSDFSLETVAPTEVIPATPGPPSGKPCRYISLEFSGLAQIPQSAALVLRAPGAAVAAIPASFSRPVSLHDYFVLPMYAGAAMVLALLLLAVIFVKVYDRTGAVMRPWRKREGGLGWNSAFWQWTVMASGAWTASDSWATNIATVTAILTGILSTTTAASAIFPGVALDRFALVNVLAGGLIAAVPLAFAILYARWTARFPGPTTDTTIVPQVPLQQNDVVTLAETVAVTWHGGIRHGELTANSTIKLRRRRTIKPRRRRGMLAVVTDGSPVSLALAAQEPSAMIASGTVIAPLPGAPDDQEAHAIRAHSPLAANTRFRLGQAAVVLSPEAFRWMRIRSGQQATLGPHLPAGPHGMPALPAGTQVSLAAGAIARFDAPPGDEGVATQNRAATLPGGAKVTVEQEGLAVPAGTRAQIRGRCQVTLTGLVADDGGARIQRALNQDRTVHGDDGRAVLVMVPAGATITLPGGAALGAIAYPDEWPVQVKDGTAIQVPPGGTIRILAGSQIALPGGSDLLVGGESALEVSGQAAVLRVAADNVAPAPKPSAEPALPGPGAGNPPPADGHPGQAHHQKKSGPPDIPLPCPVFLAAPSGAKITVNGTADVELPAGLALTAPRRKAYALRNPLHLTVPAPANALSASMRLIIVAALMTVFGVGAQLGIAGELLYDFSDASTDGRRIALGVIGLIAAFLLYYSTTAIRSLADPQPGSSMSAAPGTSFTL